MDFEKEVDYRLARWLLVNLYRTGLMKEDMYIAA